jgi:hypothetical protein
VAPRPLDPIAFRTPARTVTYRLDGGEVEEHTGGDDDASTVVAMNDAAWADLTGQLRTFINLHLSDELTYEQGTFELLAEWDPYLRLTHAGTPGDRSIPAVAGTPARYCPRPQPTSITGPKDGSTCGATAATRS